MVDLSGEVKRKLHELYKKHADLCDNADELAEPLRSIARFVKKEGSR